MSYIVIDLEFNQFYDGDSLRDKPLEHLPFEIIQIGAIKLDANLKELSRFNALVKPQVYESLHPFVEKLTKLSIDRLVKAKPFDVVYKAFIEFIGDIENTLVVWGMSDLQVLVRNINHYKLGLNQLPLSYINIQRYAARHLNTPKGTNVGLQNAIILLGIDMNLPFHDAFNDAIYTSEIFKLLYTKEISPKVYNPNEGFRPRREQVQKRVLDQKALISQLEKMYEKTLNIEEIEMIVLAYRMGASQQFLIPQEKRINEYGNEYSEGNS